jgi:hypothetical protein
VLEVVASTIETVRAELAGQPVPTAPRCPEIAAWYDARRPRDLGQPVLPLPNLVSRQGEPPA